MKGINKIGNTSFFKYPLKALDHLGVVNKFDSKAWNSDKTQAAITGLGIASLVLKDGLGCYLYVNQSLHNKKIPEDKRKFVAALDLTNGGLMIALQLLAYATISHKLVQSKAFAKLFGKYISAPAKKCYKAIIDKKFIQKGMKPSTNKVFNESVAEYENSARKAFAHFSSLIAATIIGKRVLVPFIATPLADKAKQMMDKNSEK